MWNICTYQSLTSTQDTLKKLVANGNVEEGTLIHAIEQTSGYGRHGRKWESASGNLSFSFLLKPETNPMQSASLSLVTGIALTRVIRSMLKLDKNNNSDIILKWPNDVMINGRKCAGILLENIEGNILIGVGINVCSAPFEESISLAEYNNSVDNMSLERLLSVFLETFSKLYSLWLEQGFSAFRSDFISLSYRKDTPVCVKLPNRVVNGLFQGVDDDGAMFILCKDTQKLQKITAGDVFLV